MKPPPFTYKRADSLDHAVELLAEYGEEAKLLAGGQSLVPLLNFRLARPGVLVDIGRLSEMRFIRVEEDELRLGALTTHRDIEICRDPAVLRGFGVLPSSARLIGHYPRGTIGGSLAHADPAAEWCVLARLLEADIRVKSQSGYRWFDADSFFQGYFSTELSDGEMIIEVRIPAAKGMSVLKEYARRLGDFALVIVGVKIETSDGKCQSARIVIGGVGSIPVRAEEAERRLVGSALTPETIRDSSEMAAVGIDPQGDIHGSSLYRRRLTTTLLSRALVELSQKLETGE